MNKSDIRKLAHYTTRRNNIEARKRNRDFINRFLLIQVISNAIGIIIMLEIAFYRIPYIGLFMGIFIISLAFNYEGKG